MKTDIRRISIPKGRRIIAISDVHGHKRLLAELLDAAGFCSGDELFIVGDLLAKGPESLETLRFVMELDKLDHVHVLMGNMEYWHNNLINGEYGDGYHELWEQIREHQKLFGHSFFADMLNELGIPLPESPDMAEAVKAIKSAFGNELAYLRSLPVIIETDHLIFVHGGIPTEDLDSLREQEPYHFLKNDNFMNKGVHFSKYVIVGHWPVTNYYRDYICHLPYINQKQRLISIDGGCGVKYGAQLNALILPDESRMDYSVISCDGLPVRIAAETQAESETWINIRFGDHAASIIEKGALESYVRHHSTGSVLWVMNQDIWYENGSACCVGTDYLLPVEKGEALSVYQETDRGYMVKKNGLCGWYKGRFLDCEPENLVESH